MMEMGNRIERQIPSRVKIGEEQEECDRIRSARDGRDDARIRTPEGMPRGELLNACDETQEESLARSVRLRRRRRRTGAGGRTRTADLALMRRPL